jgi:hypothetical protein
MAPHEGHFPTKSPSGLLTSREDERGRWAYAIIALFSSESIQIPRRSLLPANDARSPRESASNAQ